MEKGQLPADFDWVTPRHGCSASVFFERLVSGAEKNVTSRNAVAEKRTSIDGGVTFKTARNGPVFSVFFDGNAGTGVRIRLDGGHIHVEGQNVNVHLDCVPAPLGKDGRCRLKVGADELEEWEVLRRALEPLFFND